MSSPSAANSKMDYKARANSMCFPALKRQIESRQPQERYCMEGVFTKVGGATRPLIGGARQVTRTQNSGGVTAIGSLFK